MTMVLHVITGLGVGGAETMLARLAVGLRNLGHIQHVASLTGKGTFGAVLEEGGVPVTDLGMTSARGAMSGYLRLQRLIHTIDPDVIQGWMYHGNLAATIAHYGARHRAKRRLYWNVRASNMDDGRYGRIIRWNARLSSWTDRIIVNSQAGAAFHLARGFDYGRLEVILNGIDTSRFKPDPVRRALLRRELGLDDETPVAVHIARVDPMKDHATFLRAMEMNPQIVGVLAGAGTETLSLPPNVRALGIYSNPERLYPLADIIVSSSAFGEGFPNIIAEGMSAGLVPIATDVGDVRSIIGMTGRVVAPGDATELARAIGEVGAMPANERAGLASEARSRVVEKFAIGKAVADYERIYAD